MQKRASFLALISSRRWRREGEEYGRGRPVKRGLGDLHTQTAHTQILGKQASRLKGRHSFLPRMHLCGGSILTAPTLFCLSPYFLLSSCLWAYSSFTPWHCADVLLKRLRVRRTWISLVIKALPLLGAMSNSAAAQTKAGRDVFASQTYLSLLCVLTVRCLFRDTKK